MNFYHDFCRDNLARGKGLTWTEVYSLTRWITTLLRRKMGQNQTIIVPTLGNHDWVPANAVESMNATPYRGFISEAGFNQLLPEEAWGAFERGESDLYDSPPSAVLNHLFFCNCCWRFLLEEFKNQRISLRKNDKKICMYATVFFLPNRN